MRKERSELETAIELIEAAVCKKLIDVKVGALPHELEHGFQNLAFDGLDGEVVLLFEGGQELFISWCGRPLNTKVGGWCTELSEVTLHQNIEYIPIPKGPEHSLDRAIGNRLLAASIFGENEDPLSILFEFENVAARIGNFEYGDTIFIEKYDPAFLGKEAYGLLLWESEECA